VRLGIFNPRTRSLLRGSALVLLSLAVAFRLADFPSNHPTPLLLLPLLVALIGTADTTRCMKKRWSFYHGGVLLLVYMDLMSIFIMLFFLIYPYIPWIAAAH
jgi:hypothetical protein